MLNFDETGFRAGVVKDPWFITKDDTSARLYMEDPDNQEYITSFEFVGGGGVILPNMLSLSGKYHQEK